MRLFIIFLTLALSYTSQSADKAYVLTDHEKHVVKEARKVFQKSKKLSPASKNLQDRMQDQVSPTVIPAKDKSK